MSKSQQDMSDDSADLLTEISVAYYQDGATPGRNIQEVFRVAGKSRADAKAGP